VKLTLKISGTKVHDVGYRAFLLETAEDLRLRGFFAQNTVENGMQAVIVYLEGNEASMEKFQKIVQIQRPDKAIVSSIAIIECSDEVEDIDIFAARFQARQLRKGISSIIRIEEKQDRMIDLQTQMLGKQDQMLEKQDQMLGKQDQMLGKQDQMLEKQDLMIDKLEDVGQNVVGEIRSSTDAIVSEIRESRERGSVELRDSHADLKSYLDARLGKMDEDISRIKARIGM
jgi:acylphosphatase